jgi:6-pyruvoyl-tetrahydropterin synthase
LHGHTFQVTLRVSGELDASGMVAEFSEIKPAMRDAVAPLRRRALVPGQAPELRITPNNDSLSITCGSKRYLLPAEDVTVLPLVNTTLEALAGYLLSQVLPHLQMAGLVAAELEISEHPGTSATAHADLG